MGNKGARQCPKGAAYTARDGMAKFVIGLAAKLPAAPLAFFNGAEVQFRCLYHGVGPFHRLTSLVTVQAVSLNPISIFSC